MATRSPIQALHDQAEAAMLRFGTPEQGADVVDTFGEPEIEYAALRKGCVLLDQPQRATVRISGHERNAFLNRMLTQELKGFGPWSAKRSFWLSRKGRIDADVRLIETPEATMVDLDVLSVARFIETLSAYIITEDVSIQNDTERTHRLALHGPSSLALLRRVATHERGVPLGDLGDGQACEARIGGRPVLIDRQDSTGEIGLELLVSAADALAVHQHLIEVGADEEEGGRITGTFRLRLAGWSAYNVARVEAGWAMYQVDFGVDSLPAETGVLHDRVSFTKGCYLGQEIVARMNALGHPKQALTGLRGLVRVDRADAGDGQPRTGSRIFVDDGAEPKPEIKIVGAVTSSVRSPMLGDVPVCFAMVAWAHRGPAPAPASAGTTGDQTGPTLWIETPAGRLPFGVQSDLAFWKPAR